MPEKKIGFLYATSLVVGNMIGSGIFLLPATLAVFGYYSLAGWFFSTAGAVLLAITFSRLSQKIPATGGPYAYTEKAFGKFPGFIVAWGYWICLWTGNASIVIAFVSSMASFVPILRENNLIAAFACIVTVWMITLLNLLGVRQASHFQFVTVILKIIPIVIIATVGFFFFHSENFFAKPAEGNFPGVFFQTAALTLWSFLGIESATVPAASIENPQKNIARATVTGTLFVAVLYILASIAIMGISPPALIAKSTSPFADTALIIGGNFFFYLTSACAVISCLGTLNGWILLQGQVPYAAANDGVFPKFFQRENKNGAPVSALIVSSILICVMIFSNYTKSLQSQFGFMILLSTLSTLVPYAFCSVAELMLMKKEKVKITFRKHRKLILLSVFSLAFAIAAIIGTGIETIIYGLVLLASGVPVYLFQKRKSTTRS